MVALTERAQTLRIPTLLDRLGEALDMAGVSCCQWKGHYKKSYWESGAGDVDLLVDASMSERLDGVLDRLGFKLALPDPEGLIPGTSSWYGYDAHQRALIHVHVHVRVIVGGYWTTMYRLPIERALLDATAPRLPFAVPEPELEFLTFVLRSVQRYRILDLFAPPTSQPRWLRAAQPEFAYLLNQVDRRRLLARLAELMPAIDPAFFDACARSLRPGVSRWLRLWLRFNLHWRLRPHAHHPPRTLLLKRVLRWLHLLPRTRRMRLARGGRLLALLGADGSGKTTCNTELTRWLGAQFEVRRAHLGLPPRSLTTWVVGGVLKVQRKVLGGTEGTPGFLELLRLVCTARDRYLLFTRMRRFAEAGGIALCERYPVPQNRLLVGPEIQRLLGHGRDTPLARRLMHLERWYYRRISPPDVIMVLRVEPEVAVRRKTDEPSDYVRARARVIWDIDWAGTGAHLVDAGRSLTDVMGELKTIVWSEI